MSGSDDEIDFGNLYDGERGFYKENKTGCSFSEYTLQLPSGHPKLLRLKHIQEHSLWGDRIYNAAILLSKLIVQQTIDVRGKRILELGAATGLPSITALYYNPNLVFLWLYRIYCCYNYRFYYLFLLLLFYRFIDFAICFI